MTTVHRPIRSEPLGGEMALQWLESLIAALDARIADLTAGTGNMRNEDNLLFLLDFVAARGNLDVYSTTETNTAIADAIAAILIGAGAVTTVNTQTGDVVLDFSDVGADVLGAAAQALIDAKAYADAIASGFQPRAACAVATAAALPACTYANGTAGVGATLTANANGALTVDTVAVAVGDRVLVKNQASGFQNGIYTVTAPLGDASHPFILTRAADADASAEVPAGMVTFIAGGTAPRLAGTFVQLTPGPITVGTTTQLFDQSNAANAYTSSNGIVLTGANFAPTYGAIANTVTQGNDARLSDARTPTAHKVAHQLGGTDELALAESQVTNLPSDLAGKLAASDNLAALASKPTSRTNLGLGGAAVLNVGTTTGTVAAGDDSRFGSGGPPTGTAAGALAGTYPNPTLANANLNAVGGLTSAANKGIQFTGSGTAATYDLTAAGKAILDDADNTAQRATLSVYSIAQMNAVVGNTGGWTPANTDLWLPAGVASSGTLTGGVIRQASALQLRPTYTQTAEPTDIAMGTPLLIAYNVVLNHANPPFGPSPQTGFFGPRGLANIEGVCQIGQDQSLFAFSPVGYADMLTVKNVPGAARDIVPGWGFLHARQWVADAATVTLKNNDVAAGTASFVDSQTFATANTGTLDGSGGYAAISFLSMPFMLGNTTLTERVAFDVHDLNIYLGSITDLSSNLSASGVIPGADAGLGVVGVNYGLRITRMVGGNRNVGISNASATVNPMLAVAITATGTGVSTNTLPLGASILGVTCSTALRLTSAPTIANGIGGETIIVVNVGANALTLQDESVLTGSNLELGDGTRTLAQYESITLLYSTDAGAWIEMDRSNPFRGNVTVDFGASGQARAEGAFGIPNLSLRAPGDVANGIGMTMNPEAAVNFSDGTTTAASVTKLYRVGLDHMSMLFGTSDAIDFKPLSLGIQKTGDAAVRAALGVVPATNLPCVVLGDGAGATNNGYLYREATGQWKLASASLQARYAPVITAITSNATWSPNADTTSLYVVTAQAAAATTIANPTGTPIQGQKFGFRITDDGTARAMTWSGTQWRAPGGPTLPSTTVVGQTTYLDFVYNSTDTKWDLVRSDSIGTVSATNGLIDVTDGTNAHGKSRLAVGAFGPFVQVFGDATDTVAKAQLGTTGLQVGPGGASAADFKILRTGTAAGAVTGALTLPSPVLNTGVSGTAIDTDATMAANSDTLLPSQKAVKSAIAAGAPPTGAAGGDLTGTYPNPTVATAAVSLAKMANLAANSFIGNNTGSAAVPLALTVAQAKTLLALVKADVGLGNVDNTSNVTERAATATLTNKTLTSPVINTPTGIVKGDVGLGNVDNTSNATERAAAATLTNKTLTSPAITTPTGIVKGDVGLGNVDNTADASKTFAATAITSATMATARLGSGTANSGTFLRGDQTWAAPAGGGDMLAANNLSDVASVPTARTNLSVQPTADPTFTGTATAPAVAASGLTGAVNTLRIVGRVTTGSPPTTGTFAVGDAVISVLGGAAPVLYYCITAGTPGTWAGLSTLGTDPFWGAAGDVAVGTGNDTSARLAVGTAAGQALVADPNATNKLSWSSPASVYEANSGTAGRLISSYNRMFTASSATGFTPTSGQLYLFALPLPKGITVSTVKFWAGTTAGATLTHSWAAVYSSALAQQAVSADITTASWGASTSRTFTMDTPYQSTVLGNFYVALCIVGTTIPTIEAVTGLLATGARNTATKSGGTTTDTGLTTPASGPSTAGAVTTSTAYPYFEIA